jgi:hypothetical protein
MTSDVERGRLIPGGDRRDRRLRGPVAFPASELDPETENSQDEILRGSGGPLTTIADESDGFTSIFGSPSINDFGAVAFDGNPVGADRELIARGSGGP